MSRGAKKPYFKTAVVFLILSFCLFSFILSFHGHPDGLVHNNCPLCAAAAHLILSASQDVTALAYYYPFHEFISVAEQSLSVLPLIALLADNRAPPA